MKNKTWMIGCMLLLTLLSGKLFAQEGGEFVKRATDTMQVKLSLNDEQYKKAYDINERFGKKLAAVKQNSGRKLQQLQQMKAADQERDAAFKQILTDEQYKKYLEDKSVRRAQMKENYKKNKS